MLKTWSISPSWSSLESLQDPSSEPGCRRGHPTSAQLGSFRTVAAQPGPGCQPAGEFLVCLGQNSSRIGLSDFLLTEKIQSELREQLGQSCLHCRYIPRRDGGAFSGINELWTLLQRCPVPPAAPLSCWDTLWHGEAWSSALDSCIPCPSSCSHWFLS